LVGRKVWDAESTIASGTGCYPLHCSPAHMHNIRPRPCTRASYPPMRTQRQALTRQVVLSAARRDPLCKAPRSCRPRFPLLPQGAPCSRAPWHAVPCPWPLSPCHSRLSRGTLLTRSPHQRRQGGHLALHMFCASDSSKARVSASDNRSSGRVTSRVGDTRRRERSLDSAPIRSVNGSRVVLAGGGGAGG
jgi:hypothetical protein